MNAGAIAVPPRWRGRRPAAIGDVAVVAVAADGAPSYWFARVSGIDGDGNLIYARPPECPAPAAVLAPTMGAEIFYSEQFGAEADDIIRLLPGCYPTRAAAVAAVAVFAKPKP